MYSRVVITVSDDQMVHSPRRKRVLDVCSKARAPHSRIVIRRHIKVYVIIPATITGREIEASFGKKAATRKTAKLHVTPNTRRGLPKMRWYKIKSANMKSIIMLTSMQKMRCERRSAAARGSAVGVGVIER